MNRSVFRPALAAPLLLALSLTACVAPGPTGKSGDGWSLPTFGGLGHNEEDQLLAEANALAGQVGNGQLTRLQAADRLDQKRLALVGHNAIDDVLLQRGQIAQADLRTRLVREIDRARRNWNAMPLPQRPNAAFTRFLIRIYDQAPL